ncbi:MAG: hypothetical protein D9V46_02600 [Deltaproteobacteria bacterium]|uniref:hypothetical protein n=1 Tax=Hydrosulfovibrio ferrireducens TaxID=2934181 RepID=UPI001208CE35|nr:MAG: hypothetical protein D9V46_02600 [Deltaproteobacteria bacterium]
MTQDTASPHPTADAGGETELLTLQVDRDLFRAFQRCTWIIVHETDRSRLEIMNEMVRDFLIKHGC